MDRSVIVSHAGAHWFPIAILKSASGLGNTVKLWVMVSVQGNIPAPPACTTSFIWYVESLVLELFMNTSLNI